MSQPQPAEPVPNDTGAPTVPNRTLVLWMLGFIKPVRNQAAWCCVVLTCAIAVEVYAVQISGRAVNQLNKIHTATDATHKGLWKWFFSTTDIDAFTLRYLLLLLVVFVCAMAVLRYAREVANSKFSMNMVFFLREAIYDKLQRVGFGFHDSNSSGQLINRSLSDLQNVRTFAQSALLLTLEIILVVTGYILLILSKNVWVALLALAPLPIWTIYTIRFSKKVQPAAKAVLEAEDASIQVITENAAGVHVIKAFATEKQEVAKYTKAATEFQVRVLKRVRLFANFQPVIRLIASASHLSLFFVAGLLLILGKGKNIAGALSVGDLVILGGAMGAILGRLQQVATINEQYQNAIVSARRLWEVISFVPTVPEKTNPIEVPKRGIGEVVFEDVCFGYNPDKPVLCDVSFKVPGGAIVAIVGPTGAGKTSLINLIARFYDPQRGRITLDGVDLRDFSLSSLRSQVSLVFQETYLFSDSVSANIAYGRPGIDQGSIESASRLAQAHEFIEKLPQGYDTQLGERGMNLSGGQRQRLAIARAIVTNPRVLVLDDATAAIDAETEDLIRRGMRLTLFGRTTFVIAHRISTVKSADLVVVLEQGRVTQLGTHNQLMAEDGHYREIARVQLSDEPAVPAEMLSHMDRAGRPGEVGNAKQGAQRIKDAELEETA
ncbi:MAG: transporter transrane region [Phycisphaerales bacterium]|nr:transporter transrane region [Phycisphaerales bacterium]